MRKIEGEALLRPWVPEEDEVFALAHRWARRHGKQGYGVEKTVAARRRSGEGQRIDEEGALCIVVPAIEQAFWEARWTPRGSAALGAVGYLLSRTGDMSEIVSEAVTRACARSARREHIVYEI